MRVPSAVAWISAALCILSTLSTTPPLLADAAAVKAGAPEHLSTGINMCARTFHSKGAIGCRSLSDKDMAPLFPIATADELAQFVRGEAAQQESDQKYVLVMPETLLAYDAIKSGLDLIGGVFAYPQFGVANASFASATPQGAGTVDGALNPFADARVAWNRGGNGLIEQELPFPVVLLEDEAAGRIFQARAHSNVQRGVGATYTAFANYYFGPPTMTSLECLAFKNIYGQSSPKCDPIGGQSVWSVRGDRSAGRKIVLATAAMDTTGLSHVASPGANTAASGLVALLAAAQALQTIPDADLDKKIVFAAFQAEKFGFVGSRKFLADLQQFTREPKSCAFPVTGSASPFGSDFCTEPMLSSTEFTTLALADIAYAVAVDQVGILPKSGNFTVHVNPHASASATATANSSTASNGSTTTALVDAIVKAPSAGASFSVGTTGALPPTPLTSFVNADEFGQKDLVAAVIAGYDNAFVNSATFSSRHDVLEMLDIAAVTKAAQVLAETLYQLAAKSVSADALKTITVKKETVAELLACVTTDWRCELMKTVSKPSVASILAYLDLAKGWPSFATPPTLYSGPLDSNRQMLVKKRVSDSESASYTVYNQSWSEDTDRVKLFPNAYEVFTRAYLASAMLDASAAKAAPTCTKSQDCTGKGMECVHPGVCAKQSAYFHFAISPGLKRTKQFGLYSVVNASMPLWTEPQWDANIGSYVFPDPGELIGWLTLLIGAVITGVGVVLARLFLASVHKMKLL